MIALAIALQVAMTVPGAGSVEVKAAVADAVAARQEARAAVEALDAAKTSLAASIAAVAATVPVPRSTVPLMDTIGGAAGTAGTYLPGNTQQQRITRTFVGVTNATGIITATWAAMPVAPNSVVAFADTTASATMPTPCAPIAGTVTTTGAQVKCWTAQTVTVSLLGATVAPFTTTASGVTVRITAVP